MPTQPPPRPRSNPPSSPAVAGPETFRRQTSRLPLHEMRAAARQALRGQARTSDGPSAGGQTLALIVSWSAVMLPLAWGVAETLRKTAALFQ